MVWQHLTKMFFFPPPKGRRRGEVKCCWHWNSFSTLTWIVETQHSVQVNKKHSRYISAIVLCDVWKKFLNPLCLTRWKTFRQCSRGSSSHAKPHRGPAVGERTYILAGLSQESHQPHGQCETHHSEQMERLSRAPRRLRAVTAHGAWTPTMRCKESNLGW